MPHLLRLRDNLAGALEIADECELFLIAAKLDHVLAHLDGELRRNRPDVDGDDDQSAAD